MKLSAKILHRGIIITPSVFYPVYKKREKLNKQYWFANKKNP